MNSSHLLAIRSGHRLFQRPTCINNFVAFLWPFLSAFSLKSALVYITYFSLFQVSYSQDPETLIRLRDQFARAFNKSVEPVTSKYIQQLELLKQNSTSDEAANVENEILKIKKLREDGFVQSAIAQVEVADSATGSVVASGRDYRKLAGVWVAPGETYSSGYGSSSSVTTYEFKSSKKMIVTRTDKRSNGSISESVQNYSVKQINDKLVIEIEREGSSGYSSQYRNGYEIALPFSYDKPELSQVSVHSGGSSKTIIFLERKSEDKGQSRIE